MHSYNPRLAFADVGLEMHDPLPIWYCLSSSDPKWRFVEGEDIRVESAGQWTRGSCVVDRRGRPVREGAGELGEEVAGDTGGWLDGRRGNRVGRCVGSPGTEGFAGFLLERVFGGLG